MTRDLLPNEEILANFQVFPMMPHDGGDMETSAEALEGICPVCGNDSAFDGFTENKRESGRCFHCGSFNRQRQVATMIRALYGMDAFGPFRFPEGHAVYNTESSGALHEALLEIPGYVFSEYFGAEAPPGGEVKGIRNENLQDLSFDDASFDLVLSSDVLEHMPMPYIAHREIFRVLKAGGRHIFTVSFQASEALDDMRAIEINHRVEYFGEKLFHGAPIRPEEGSLVWRIFGLQMIVELARIGFVVSCWNLRDPARGIVGPWSIVFDARKPG